jgi:RNA polymerase sporulation-specific sigma factor
MLEAIFEFFRNLLVLAGCVGSGGFPAKLTPAEEAELIKRLGEGDEDAKNRLIEGNLRLVAHIAKKFRAAGRDTDDLISIGSIGLIKAVSTYRPEKGKSLASYAGRCIENEILMSIRAERRRRGEVSLDAPIGVDRDGNEMTVADVLGTDEDQVFGETFDRMRSERLRAIVSGVLEGRERAVIMLRYGLDGGEPLPQREAAKLIGISRSYVSRIEKKAVAKLRAAMENDPEYPV